MKRFDSSRLKRRSIMLVLLAVALPALGYEVFTHRQMTAIAGLRSQLFLDNSLAWHIGLGVDQNSSISYEYVLYDEGVLSFEELWSVVGLIQEGAEREDDYVRVVNHFFDPVNGGMIETDLDETESPVWALEDDGDDHQEWSYHDMMNHLYAAITATEEAESDQAYAQAFRSLGQVVHLIQDMAQPEHARVDGHCYVFAVCSLFTGEGREYSFYEWFSLQLSNGGLRNAVGDVVVGPATAGNYPNVHLYSLRDYWTQNAGMGLADYTNRSFVTPDTNFDVDAAGRFVTTGFADPGLANWSEATLDGTQVTLFDGTPLPGELTLIRVPLSDNYLGTGLEWTHDTSSETLLSADIRAAIDNGVPPERFEGHNNRFYLNRFNYESTNRHLFQRAIGYTAGFIDHVFRGRIEIKPPEGGIYAIVDHAVTNDADADPPVGFTSIKLRFRNATPQQNSPDPQVVSEGHIVRAGTLVAVAHYRPNPCYEADLSGEMHENANIPSGCSVQQWRVTEQHRVVSAEIPVSAGDIDTLDYTEKTFDFSANPIPINARDLSIQLVFRGELGGDEDAIAVGRKDISEPTWLGGMASRDYISVNGTYLNTQAFLDSPESETDWNILTEEQEAFYGVKGILSVQYSNAATGEVLAGWPALPHHAYNRLAVLAEPDEVLRIRSIVYYNDYVESAEFWMTPIETFLEEEPVLVEIPDIGFLTILQRQWTYTPIYNYRGARGLMINPFHLRLGPEQVTIEDVWALPPVENIADPLPIPLL